MFLFETCLYIKKISLTLSQNPLGSFLTDNLSLCRLKWRGIRFQSKQTIILITVSSTAICLMSDTLSVSLSSLNFWWILWFQRTYQTWLGDVLFNSPWKMCGTVQTFKRWVSAQSPYFTNDLSVTVFVCTTLSSLYRWTCSDFIPLFIQSNKYWIFPYWNPKTNPALYSGNSNSWLLSLILHRSIFLSLIFDYHIS